MGYPSCRDFSQVRSSRTILSAVPTELSHLSLSHILRIVICGFSSVSFFTNRTVHSFLAETGRPPTVTILTFPALNLSNHLQTLLYKKKKKRKKGSTCICQISMDFLPVVSQFHQCEHIEIKLLSFWIHFLFSGTIDDITFLITSYSHMTDDVSTILCMVREWDVKFLLMQVFSMWLI